MLPKSSSMTVVTLIAHNSIADGVIIDEPHLSYHYLDRTVNFTTEQHVRA